MRLPRPFRPAALHPLALGCTVVTATFFAACWALLVPFFEQPDELAHTDYAFMLANVGRPFTVAGAKQGHAVTPEARYLRDTVRYRQNRYATVVRLPDGYGGARFFRRLDAAAPVPDPDVPRAGSVLPYVMFVYPPGYYTLAALAMNAAAVVRPDSLTARFFAARFVGVVCLPFTLLLGYGTLLRARCSPQTALLGTAALGCLPVTLWVSGYVQPDGLATLLATAALYCSLRWKDAPHARRWPVSLSASLIALAFVKGHYAFTVALATALTALTMRGLGARRAVALGVTFGVPLVAIVAGSHLTPAGATRAPDFSGARVPEATTERLLRESGLALRAFQDAYAGGGAFRDFWLRYGLHGTSVVPSAAAPAALGVLSGASLGALALSLARLRFLAGRLSRVWRRRSPGAMLRLFFGDPLTNAYVLLTALLVTVYAVSGGVVWLEGRYWLPVIVPLAAIVLVRNLRLWRVPVRRAAGVAIAALWAAFSIVTAPLGIASIEQTYYAEPHAGPAREPYAAILALRPGRGCRANAAADRVLVVGGDCALGIEGYAVDGSRGTAAADVFVTADGRLTQRARTGGSSPLLRSAYNDDALANAGFAARVDARRLGPGRHVLGVAVIETGRPRVRYAPATLLVDVRPVNPGP